MCVTAALFAPVICAAQTLPAQSSSLNLRRVSDALDAGQYDVAEQIASAAYSPFEPPTPPTLNSLPSLRLLLAAKVKNGKSADNETVTLAARALNVIIANPAVSVEDTAATSETAASLFVERGEYSQARRVVRIGLRNSIPRTRHEHASARRFARWARGGSHRDAELSRGGHKARRVTGDATTGGLAASYDGAHSLTCGAGAQISG